MKNTEELTPVPACSSNATDYVTVVSVGSNESKAIIKPEVLKLSDENLDYITVLKIGNDEDYLQTVTEEVVVYRLPGEKLGFGLKFEGGTKPAEFVKRLFIQSCALNSPASRVQSSWGSLAEGDEVLEIDSVPVNSMTRIDCVRCLKDSNVVIKLLIKHCFDEICHINLAENCTRSTEDLPLVVSAEKKRTPPPPPPVPPRKVNRKTKDGIVIPPKGFGDASSETNGHVNPGSAKIHRMQSPYNSNRKIQPCPSPEVTKRVRRLSADMVGPPDAEVYTDLFSQESACSLSESDDTGSSISTVVDRLGSFPTTTNSSFAGSLPSTPTPIPKHMHLSEDIDFTSENYLFKKLVTSTSSDDDVDTLDQEASQETFQKTEELSPGDNTPLQPPANFQDAPLSYGNEDVRSIKQEIRLSNGRNHENGNKLRKNDSCSNKMRENDLSTTGVEDTSISVKCNKQPPPPPPRIKHQQQNKKSDDVDVAVVSDAQKSLPRLVDFVPKSNRKSSAKEAKTNYEEVCNNAEIITQFLENEKRTVFDLVKDNNQNLLNIFDSDICVDSFIHETKSWTETADINTLGWTLSSKLATIGEDEEEVSAENLHERKPPTISYPVVIIENADCSVTETIGSDDTEESEIHEECYSDVTREVDEQLLPQVRSSSTDKADHVENRFDNEIMDRPPIYPRQPPDGHEFPDYQETPITPKQYGFSKISVKPPLVKQNAIWETTPTKDRVCTSNVRDKIAIFSNASNTLTKKYVSSDNLSFDEKTEITNNILDNRKKLSKSTMSLNTLQGSSGECLSFHLNDKGSSAGENIANGKTRSSIDLACKGERQKDPTPRLHMRSLSLVDVSTTENSSRHDRWALLVEQRRKSISKLRDLVIPEHVSENDVDIKPVVDLPEIKSSAVPLVSRLDPISTKDVPLPVLTHVRNSSTPCLQSPPWHSKESNIIPKYSPAFKRKNLHVYGATLPLSKSVETGTIQNAVNSCHVNSISNIIPIADDGKFKAKQSEIICKGLSNIPPNNDPPKSLESITSPTRSDCSFEYGTSSPELRIKSAPLIFDRTQIQVVQNNLKNNALTECAGRSEDDSDSDSALSSSQSSYISKTSPRASPVHLQMDCTSHRLCSATANDRYQKKTSSSCQLENEAYDSFSRRLLKPQSVEAINRKNILASARCRSGRDLKVGSPLIQRKFDEINNKPDCKKPEVQSVATDLTDSIDISDNHLQNDVATSEQASQLPASRNHVVEVSEVLEVEKCVNEPKHASEIQERNKTEDSRPAKKNIHVPPSRTIAKTPSTNSLRSLKVVSATSVTDLRKNFEKSAPTPALRRSLHSASSENIALPIEPRPVKRTSLPIITKPEPLKLEIVPEQLAQKLIDDTLKEFDEKIEKPDVKVVAFKPEITGGSLGITLAGGADYETKEIMVHKIRNGSPAFRDGRLQKGDRILSINGKPMKGLSHSQSLAILKENVPEVVIVASSGKEITSVLSPKQHAKFDYTSATTVKTDIALDTPKIPTEEKTFEVVVTKDSTGLGFSIQGGKGSALGDMPLVIKKIFMGGAAERTGKLIAGDVLLAINATDVTPMSRIDAWNLMKKIPEGEAVLRIRR